ncbi:MAG TPA: CARDB domain-containing protein [Solirubrobacteraceae bacterium]
MACTAVLVALVAAGPARAQTVPTRASLDACHTGAAALDRFAVFSAQMGAVSGTKRMQVRFDLLQRVPGTAFRRIQAPGLGAWRSSVPGIDIFRYHKQVANLAAPGQYRALVRFRWLGDGGRVLQQAQRRTRTCKQPDLRADLVIGGLTAERAGPGRFSYTVIVRNDGRSATPAFAVVFAVGKEAQPPQTVRSLAAGEKRALTFVGPRCDTDRPVRVSVDTDLAVDEANEGNNVRTLGCPLDV